MQDDEPVFRGGCLCGQVRYEAVGSPLSVSLCHCRNCRKNTASAFSVNAIFPESAVRLTGRLAVFDDKGDSGQPVQRLFCPECGTPIRSMAGQTAGLFVIKAGTLDEPERVRPTDAIYCRSRVDAWALDVVEHPTLPDISRQG